MKMMLGLGTIVPPVKEGPQWECRARPLGMMMNEMKMRGGKSKSNDEPA